ncbi:MAG: DUF3109 family protein [Prevotellaceae bacterium]|jgi:hypothetical protein|nr:DUF3109 family protein [Prevotellaceae bacterium]
MLQIDDKIISLDLFKEYFTCNISECKGSCCVCGDSGAPLEDEEKSLLETYIGKIEPYLASEALEIIEKQGVAIIDSDSELVTPLLGDSEECVYSYFLDDGTCLCAIEKAFSNGDIPFNKPVSCHLYPIRIKNFGDITALNYDRWSICTSAREQGATNGQPVFRFLKTPLIRKFGENFYKSMEDAYSQWIKSETENI